MYNINKDHDKYISIMPEYCLVFPNSSSIVKVEWKPAAVWKQSAVPLANNDHFHSDWRIDID